MNDVGEIVTGRGKDGTGHDLLDALRYLVRNFKSIMSVKPDPYESRRNKNNDGVGRDPIGGY